MKYLNKYVSIYQEQLEQIEIEIQTKSHQQ